MPYDASLERRIDGLTAQLGPVTKKKMFGGVGYLVNGNMCFGIHKDRLILRTSAEAAEELLRDEHFKVFDMTGRPMPGWLSISPEAAKSDGQLLSILRQGFQYAEKLRAK